ncbi:ProQ/FINO family protein [Acidithiobacillus ferrianus]|uniref:ProQ/FinO domain-containing protein n=2 Tax=Acidithiobacillus ferrianus TaxID=2678518 RepID=A0A845U372_9PROT|nr:ProQ/FINO family protein [Acidithiobacillus ferrianus]NDU42072.1 hypothetical protein [Acidithiobacillus ferrianus]
MEQPKQEEEATLTPVQIWRKERKKDKERKDKERKERALFQAAFEARMKAERDEIFSFPVFQQGRILPFKYRLHQDLIAAIISNRAKAGKLTRGGKKDVIEAVTRRLKKYCAAEEYKLAAVIEQKRYDLNANVVGKISEKDMYGFVAFVKMIKAKKRAYWKAKKERENG